MRKIHSIRIAGTTVPAMQLLQYFTLLCHLLCWLVPNSELNLLRRIVHTESFGLRSLLLIFQ